MIHIMVGMQWHINGNTQLTKSTVLQLVCDGIDTKAKIFINDQLIFINDNMFQKNIINLNTLGYGNDILMSGQNIIKIGMCKLV